MRTDMIYKIRRKLQVLAYDITTPEFISKVYFKIVVGRSLNLNNPRSFNEKIQWYKLNYCAKDKRIVLGADKYRVREYLQSKGLDDIAVPLIGAWESVEEIPWSKLPPQYVIKCNHGCGYNLICKDQNSFSVSKAKKLLSSWMKEDFGKFNAEPHYSLIKPEIVCEQYMVEDEKIGIIDYKIHCFNGNPKFILVCTERNADGKANYIYYDLNWNKLDYSLTESIEIEKPSLFNEMISLSKILSEDFPFVRVDLYIHKGKIYLGELTFVPAGGLDNTISEAADIEIGEMLELNL